jgi:hypothetical protein
MNRDSELAQIAGDLNEARELLEAAMAEKVTITRPGATVTDMATGEVTTVIEVVATGVPARITMRALAGFYESRPYVAGHYVTVDTVKITVPVGTPVKVGDTLEITASPNPESVGRQFRISNTQAHTQISGLRLSGEEVTLGR